MKKYIYLRLVLFIVFYYLLFWGAEVEVVFMWEWVQQ